MLTSAYSRDHEIHCKPVISLESIKNRQAQRQVNHLKNVSHTDAAAAFVKNLDIYKDALESLTL